MQMRLTTPIVVTLALAAMALGGCAAPTRVSESHVSTRAPGTASDVDRCRVLEVRRIAVDARTRSGNRYADAAGAPEEAIGSLVGGIVGGVVGNNLAPDNYGSAGTAIGAAIGGAGGRRAGTEMATRRTARTGLEYSVLMADGQERVIVQDTNPGDRIARAGTTCRVVQSRSGLRVLPASHLPAAVNAPRQTRMR